MGAAAIRRLRPVIFDITHDLEREMNCLIMETADSKKQSAEVLLHALSMVGSDAWCFAPIDQDSLTHCSRSFMTMWGFDL